MPAGSGGSGGNIGGSNYRLPSVSYDSGSGRGVDIGKFSGPGGGNLYGVSLPMGNFKVNFGLDPVKAKMAGVKIGGKFKKGGKVSCGKKMAKGGSVKCTRGDGCAKRGKTKGKMC